MFRPNPRFIEELQREDGVRKAIVDAAGAVARRVQSHDIMRRKGTQPIEVEDTGEEVRVINTDHGGHLDEFGSANNPPYAPLRTGVRAAGLRLDEHGK